MTMKISKSIAVTKAIKCKKNLFESKKKCHGGGLYGLQGQTDGFLFSHLILHIATIQMVDIYQNLPREDAAELALDEFAAVDRFSDGSTEA